MDELRSFDTRPILLRGDRVGLAAMVRGDVPTIARWHQDLSFTAQMGTPGEMHTIEQREKAFERNAAMRADSVEFAVVGLDSGELVGFGGLFDISAAGAATLFVGIGDPGRQNQGLGSEATRLLCEYGFFFRSLHAIKVEVNGFNERALRVYRRLGFRLVGRLRGTVLLNGRRHDQVILDLLREEFSARYTPAFESLICAAEAADPLVHQDLDGSNSPAPTGSRPCRPEAGGPRTAA